MATVYLADCERLTVQAAIDAAADGDTIIMPAGTATWGASNSYLNVYKPVTILGAGPGLTTIIASATGPSGTTATIRIYAAAKVGGFTWQGIAGRLTSPFQMAFGDGFRVTNVQYLPVQQSYFALVSGSFGLIDNCEITGSGGGNELIFVYGKSNAWQTPAALGTADAVYVEGCVFNGPGYVCDVNANGKIVVRNCLINGEMKLDVHGVASNTPPRSGRSIEAYNNRWTRTNTGGFWASSEIRGGTGVLFNNTVDDNTFIGRGYLRMLDYGAIQALPNFGGQFQTPYDYPIKDQIGVGMDPKVAASEPMYVWEYRKAGALIGPLHPAIPQGAIDRYRAQTGNPTATFTMADIVQADRDYFIQTSATFTGASGVGVGTRAQMDAITPTKTGVGFWVTNESSWNTTEAPNTSGRLYVWSGSAWVLHYTPYTYPHPLTGDVAEPSFTVSPSNQTVFTGGTATLVSAAIGNPSPAYQWYKNGVAISGAASGSLTITDAEESDEATYYVTATNSEGAATSASATITVDTPTPTPSAPTITLQPQSASLAEGAGNASLLVIATGYPVPDYQWRKGGVDIPGAMSSTLSLGTITAEDAGTYTVLVGNSEGFVVSNPAVITVVSPTDTTPPTPNPSTIASVVVNGSTSITVTATTATDADSPPVEYNHAINNTYAGWQSSRVRIFTGLTAGTSYAFKVKARDVLLNETTESGVANETTATVGGGVGSVMGNRGTRRRVAGVF